MTHDQATQAEANYTLESAIRIAINTHSAENDSNTPDFILAQYLLGCLEAFNMAVQQRETWYGRDARPSLKSPSVPPVPNADDDSTHATLAEPKTDLPPHLADRSPFDL
jgi:hypothetical protein